MFRKLLLTSSIIFSLFSVIYPSKKENTQLFSYCYSLEKILVRNSIEQRKTLSLRIKSVSKDFSKLGISKTRGAFINKMIDQYKNSKNNFLINIVPNQFYCFGGYWMENAKPGIFENIIFEKSKKRINELKDIKDGLDSLINNIDSEYKSLKKEFNIIF